MCVCKQWQQPLEAVSAQPYDTRWEDLKDAVLKDKKLLKGTPTEKQLKLLKDPPKNRPDFLKCKNYLEIQAT